MRVHELAKNEELETKEVIKILNSLGIKNKKSANKLNDEELGKFQLILHHLTLMFPNILITF